MYIKRLTAQSIAVTGAGNTAVTTVTVPATFTPAGGCIYDILISAQVPEGTDGTIFAISDGTTTWNVYQRSTGNYSRCRGLSWRKVVRVQFFDDPAHFNLLMIRG